MGNWLRIVAAGGMRRPGAWSARSWPSADLGRLRRALPRARAAYNPRPMEQKARWLVDGFNVLHAGVLRGNDRSGWWREEMRARLLERVAAFEDGAAELWVVFDGPGPGAERRSPRGARAWYSPRRRMTGCWPRCARQPIRPRSWSSRPIGSSPTAPDTAAPRWSRRAPSSRAARPRQRTKLRRARRPRGLRSAACARRAGPREGSRRRGRPCACECARWRCRCAG